MKCSLIIHDETAILHQNWERIRWTTVLVQFWSGSGTLCHCIAPSRSKGPQGSSRSQRHVTSPCSRMLAILTTPSWYPCTCCNHRCQTRGHQLGIILQSLNRVRDGTRGMPQAGWKFCLNKCKFTKCSCGNIVTKTEYAPVVIFVYSCH